MKLHEVKEMDIGGLKRLLNGALETLEEVRDQLDQMERMFTDDQEFEEMKKMVEKQIAEIQRAL